MLIAQDGTQLCAQLGMVDKDGAMFYVVDSGTSMRLEHVPMSWLMCDLEAETRRLERDLDDVHEAWKREHEMLGRALKLCDELLANGSFPLGTKTPFKERLWKLRNEYGKDEQ